MMKRDFTIVWEDVLQRIVDGLDSPPLWRDYHKLLEPIESKQPFIRKYFNESVY